MIDPKLPDTAAETLRGFFNPPDADPDAIVEVNIAFDPVKGWRVCFDVSDSGGHVSCLGDLAQTFDEAFKSACSKF